jgi:hypothetical protein
MGANRESIKLIRCGVKENENENAAGNNPTQASALSEESVSEAPAIHMTRRELDMNMERAKILLERMDGVLGLVGFFFSLSL